MSLEDDELRLWLDMQAGEFDRVYANLTRLLTVVTDPPSQGRLEGALGVLLQRAGSSTDAHVRFTHALSLLDGSDNDRAFVLAIMSLASVLSGEVERAQGEAEEAIRLGGATGNDFAVGQGNTTLTLVHLASSRPREALACSDLATSGHGPGRGEAEYLSIAYVLRGMAFAELDRFDEAHAAVAEGVRLAEPVGHMGQLSFFRSAQALMHFLDGQWDVARREADLALQDAVRTGVLVARGLAWGVAGFIEGIRGNISEATEIVEIASTNRAGPFGGIGEEWVSIARSATAATPDECYDALCDAWFRTRGLPYQLAWKVIAHPLVSLAVKRGDLLMAEAVNARVQTGAERAAGVASAEGTALCCQGSLEGSRELLDRGIARLREAGRPLPLGIACRSAARLSIEQGDSAHALALLSEAADVFYRLGATTWSAVVTRDVVRATAGLSDAAAPETSAAAWESLSAAERRVAQLAVSGLTNRQIAEELGVSPRTVQTQLASARSKLGVASRVELAARFSSVASTVPAPGGP